MTLSYGTSSLGRLILLLLSTRTCSRACSRSLTAAASFCTPDVRSTNGWSRRRRRRSRRFRTRTCGGTRCAASGSPAWRIGSTGRSCRRRSTTRWPDAAGAPPTELPDGDYDARDARGRAADAPARRRARRDRLRRRARARHRRVTGEARGVRRVCAAGGRAGAARRRRA